MNNNNVEGIIITNNWLMLGMANLWTNENVNVKQDLII